MKPVVILDLDGCISDDAWRLKWARAGDWHAYHSLAPFDRAYNLHVAPRRHRIAILTGRPENFRVATTEWLARVGVEWELLLMRPEGCRDSSVELKWEMVGYAARTMGVRLAQIERAYDDRGDIVAMYRGLGIPATRLYIPSQLRLDL